MSWPLGESPRHPAAEEDPEEALGGRVGKASTGEDFIEGGSPMSEDERLFTHTDQCSRYPLHRNLAATVLSSPSSLYEFPVPKCRYQASDM